MPKPVLYFHPLRYARFLNSYYTRCNALITSNLTRVNCCCVLNYFCSPPVRSAVMVAKEIGLELELKWVIKHTNLMGDIFHHELSFIFREVDFLNSEHMSEGFKKVRKEIGLVVPWASSKSKLYIKSNGRLIRHRRFLPWLMEMSSFLTGTHCCPFLLLIDFKLVTFHFSAMPSIFIWLKSTPGTTIYTQSMTFFCERP